MDYSDVYGCRNSGMPLGGIGAGSVELRPDGYFYRWNFMNNRPWGAGPETQAMERTGLRFALAAKFADGQVRTLSLGKHHGMDPKEDGWFWMSDPYHLPWVEHTPDIAYRARIPFAELEYGFAGLPLRISLRAWSPFVPHQAEDSNTPGCVLTFRITNGSNVDCEMAVMGLLKNVVGYDRPELVSLIRVNNDGPVRGLVFGRAGMNPQASSAGSVALSVDAADISYAIHPRHGRDLFDPLRKTGRLENTDYGRAMGAVGEIGAETAVDGPKGMQRGALAAHVKIAAGQSATCTFYLTWHFPNFWELDRKNATANLIGVQYANRFDSATSVATWLHRESERLYGASRDFHQAFYGSTLPVWELDAVSACFSVLLRAAWWDKTGRFGIWEGLGCCGLQTIDVGHYASFPIVQFFPELDTAQNELSAAHLEPSGKVPHNFPGCFSKSDSDGRRGRIDLGPQFILAVWRNALCTGKLDHARRMWEAVRKNVEWMIGTDTDGDGLPNNQGPDQTYDRFPLHGTSAFVGFLYLASLRATADLAKWLGHEADAAKYAALAETAGPALRKQLYNGEYFNLSHDSGEKGTNTGCMTDQLNGDWFYRQSGGEGVVDDGLARTALTAVYRHNRRTAGPHAWLANCTWPSGGGVEITRQGSDQANCPWSGVEYAVAAHMMLLGLRKEARQVAWDVFERYEDAGMRFNHIECGEFYYRAMSAWAVYLAEFGIVYDGIRERLSISPPAEVCRFVITTAGAVAEALWRGPSRELRLHIITGKLAIRELRVRGEAVAVSPAVLGKGEDWVVHAPPVLKT